MNKPHKHAAFIKAWADGTEIEYRLPNGSGWMAVTSDTFPFHAHYDFRIKPDESDIEKYGVEVGDIWYPGVVILRMKDGINFSITGSAVGFNENDKLLFRRGVVNKL